jgi:hypothetical protein
MEGGAAMAPDYTVRINRHDGVLEVTGPEKEWVDEKIEQLTSVLSDFQLKPAVGGGARRKPRSTPRKGRAEDAVDKAQDGTETPIRRRGSGGRSDINEDLRDSFSTEVKQKLKNYIGARRKAWDGSQSAQAAIIATFLHDELGFPGVDQHDLYTVYTVMGERSPGNIRSQLTNARQRARYFSGLSNGKMILSHAGENFARFDSLGDAGDAPGSES